MTEKLRNLLLPVVFIGFWAVLLVLFLLLPDRAVSDTEKRNLTTTADFARTGVADGTFQSTLEDYTADQFPGRNLFTGLQSYENLLWGRNAAQEVYHGKAGYLVNAPTRTDGRTFAMNLSQLDAFARNTGLPATLIAVPETGYLLPEVLPAGAGAYDDAAFLRQAKETMTSVSVLDVTQPLRDGNGTAPVCYRTDHHLTAWGNYTVYRTYQESVDRDWAPPEAYTVETCDGFYGSAWSASGYWLTPPDTIALWDRGLDVTVTLEDGSTVRQADALFFTEHLEAQDKYPVYLDGNHALTTIHNPGGSGTLLVVRDSFAHCLGAFLAGDYETVYLVDLRYYRGNLTQFVQEHSVDGLLYVYGMDSLLTDTNSAWLE